MNKFLKKTGSMIIKTFSGQKDSKDNTSLSNHNERVKKASDYVGKRFGRALVKLSER